MDRCDPQRVFLVGFPRSGTTLLQALLAAHPLIETFPETFFFVDLIPHARRRTLLGLPGPRAEDRFARILAELSPAPSPVRSFRFRALTRRRLASRFVSCLDRVTVEKGKRAWVEKTPSHLHMVGAIEHYVKGAKLVHLVRAGEPAVASLYAVTQDHPQRWGGPRTLDQCAERWQQDVRRTYACMGRPNHAFVSYEQLVAEPTQVLAQLVRWIGLADDPATVGEMLSGYGRQLPKLASDEPWKDDVMAPIVNRNRARLDELLSAREQDELGERLASERRLVTGLPFVAGPP